MRISLLFLLFCMLPLWLQSQVLIQDDFSDGDLLNPTWIGDVDKFTVNAEGMLQLNDTGAGNSMISLVAQAVTDQAVSYEFLVNFPFALSSSNFPAILLTGIGEFGDASSYQLTIGGISGDNDALEFTASQADVSAIPLISGTQGALGGSPINARIRLSRSADNIWTLEADYNGGTDFQLEGTAQDINTAPANLQKFSLFCQYTATRATAFSFDDFIIGPVLPDTLAPSISQAELIGNNSVEVLFSEPVLPEPINQVSNYQFNIGSPALTALTVGESSVRLLFDGPLPAGVDMQLTIGRVVDCSGNEASDLSASFFIPPTATPSASNIVITEFMADPTPEVGLPNAEYVEIFNRGDTLVTLEDLRISTGGTQQNITAAPLEPGQYLLIVRPADAASFPSGLRLGIANTPALVNGSGQIRLHAGEQVIQELNYRPDWFDDPSKADGGYSLELTDPYADNLNCAGLWAASRDPLGGTPGRQNSVIGLAIDTIGPELLTAFFVEGGIEISFSKTLAASISPSDFILNPDLGLESLEALGENSYLLRTQNEPQSGQVYSLTVSEGLEDCAGNPTAGNRSLELGLAEEALPGDVVINEILFNPYVGGVDFVEVFNCSDKILSVNGWSLLNEATTSSNNRQNIRSNALLLPGGFLVFTPDVENILENYPEQAQREFLVRNDLPSLPDDAGNLTLLSPTAELLDQFDYTEEMHSQLISDQNGISLERISSKAPTQQAGNWFSAASSVGYATPTRPNSQTRATDNPGGADQDGFFFLEEDILSPNGDGFQDALLIQYLTPGPGWNARLRIFDANGRQVKILRRSELLAGSGSIIWDGSREDGQRARSGIYVVLIERFNPDGSTANEKLVAVVSN